MTDSGFFAYPAPAPAPESPARAEPSLPAPFLEGADDREWETLLSFMQTRILDAGDVIVHEGGSDRALYLLTAGRLALTAGDEPELEMQAPVPFNELSFVDGGPCAAGARALTPGELLRLSFDAFEAMAVRHPVLARKILLDVSQAMAAALRSLAASEE